MKITNKCAYVDQKCYTKALKAFIGWADIEMQLSERKNNKNLETILDILDWTLTFLSLLPPPKGTVANVKFASALLDAARFGPWRA